MDRMRISETARRVRVYLGESDQWRGAPLYLRILELLRNEGCAGGTVVRGIAGFGAGSRIHTSTILRLSEDLPVVVEWVDSDERVHRVLPKITAMVESGMITMEDVQVVQYRHQAVPNIASRLRVREVMSRGVASIGPTASLGEAVALLVRGGLRALPVVDPDGTVVGIITNSDLVERGGLRTRVELLEALTPTLLAAEMEALEAERTVADVMTAGVVTVSPETTLEEAARIMVSRRLKRLPVVDAQRRLTGMISRVDILRSAAASSPSEKEAPIRRGTTIDEVMSRDVPTVGREAPISEVLDAVISTRLHQAFVLDEHGRLVGTISDEELTRRLTSGHRPGLIRYLASRLPFASLPQQDQRQLEGALGTTAEQLMVPEVPAVSPDTSVSDATKIMLRGRHKLLAVVEEGGALVGAVDRAHLLRVVAGETL